MVDLCYSRRRDQALAKQAEVDATLASLREQLKAKSDEKQDQVGYLIISCFLIDGEQRRKKFFGPLI